MQDIRKSIEEALRKLEELDENQLLDAIKENKLMNIVCFGNNEDLKVLAQICLNKITDKKILFSLMLDDDINIISFLNEELEDKIPDSIKLEMIEDTNPKLQYDKKAILATLNFDSAVYLLNSKEEWKKDFTFNQIFSSLDEKTKKEVLLNLDKIDIDEIEKKEILINQPKNIKEELKQTIDEKYLPLLNLEIKDYYYLEFDPNIDMNIYRGFDSKIYLDPISNPSIRKKIDELYKVCPNIRIRNGEVIPLETTTVSYEEYKKAEQWIIDLIDKIDPSYSDIEKVAFVDCKVGEKISYSPEYGTKYFSKTNSRVLWTIINSGTGVCNRISQLEKYILNIIGIECKMVSSNSHSYLMIENIDIPRSDGTQIRGNTLLDGTWNLFANMYGFYPIHFARSYEELRKVDIKDGKDMEIHKSDELENLTSTIDIEESILRKVYKKLGRTDQDGKFMGNTMVKNILQKQETLSQTQMMEEIFSQIKQFNPNYIATQNSTISCIGALLRFQNVIDTNECVISRTYKKEKPDKPLFYVYLNNNSCELFYMPNPKTGEMEKLTQEEFQKNYGIYEEDLTQDGKPLWQEKKEELENLRNSIGKKNDEVFK